MIYDIKTRQLSFNGYDRWVKNSVMMLIRNKITTLNLYLHLF